VKTRLFAAALCATLAVAASRQAVAADELGKLLAAAVDQPTPKARLEAAVRLAGREDVTLEAWLAAMRAFAELPRAAAGTREERAGLQVGDALENATIALHVPEGYAVGTPAPLLLALHGAGGEGHDEDELWAQASEKLGMIVVAPTDPSADLGYRYSEAERNRALAALRWARRHFDVDENRVFVTGVSRGGHLTWDLITRHPGVFAAAVPMIGGPRLQIAEGQNNLRYMENAAYLPIRDVQGAKDDARLLDNLTMAFHRLDAFKAKDAKLVLCPDMGHDFDPHAVDWVKFLGGAARQSVPLRVVRATARLDEARAFWAEATRFQASVDEKFRALIEQKKVKTMDESEMREWAQEEADKRTARLEVRLDGPGKFSAESRLVQRFRLLLSEDMFVPGTAVEVTTNGKAATYEAKPSKLILLREFVERFDRTFLPIAEVSCP
jgi:poly(3-hydroxybutyrate) depolymerase